MKKRLILLPIATLGLAACALFTSNIAPNETLEVQAGVSDELIGEGTESSPYLITNDIDMATFKDGLESDKDGNNIVYRDVHFKLTSDVNLTLTKTSKNEGKFYGVFDGCGYTVNLIQEFNSATTEHVSFMYHNFGTVKNLNVDSESEINIKTGFGSVCDYNYGLVTHCNNYADITATNAFVGGVVNVFKTGTVSHCNNYGNITTLAKQSSATYEYVGGVVGQMQITVNGGVPTVVEYCNNYGTIEGLRGFAGVVGGVNGATDGTTTVHPIVRYCENYGLIDGRSHWTSTDVHPGCVSGIISSASVQTEVYNCSNFGEVKAISRGASGFAPVSGVVAVLSGRYVTIRNCGNYANITSSNLVSGIIGYDNNQAYLTVADCVNTGTITADGQYYYAGDANCGGLMAAATKTATISNFLQFGKVVNTGTNTNYVGLGVAKDISGNVNNKQLGEFYSDVNNSSRELVKEVRKFDCNDANADLGNTLSNLLLQVENDTYSASTLGSLSFLDKRGNIGNDYLTTARYIISVSTTSTVNLSNLLGVNTNNQISVFLIVSLCSLGVTITLITCKRQKKN